MKTFETTHLVLALDFPPSIGGIQQYVRQLWGSGTIGSVTVIAPQRDGDSAFDTDFPGTVIRLPGGSGFRAAEYLSRMMIEIPRRLSRNTVVHVTNVLLAPAILPLLPLLRNRLITYTHALELTHPRLQWPIHVLLRNATYVATVSAYSRILAIQHGAHEDRIRLVPPGGDALKTRYPAPTTTFREKFGIAVDDFLIFSCGRVSAANRYKGFDRAIEVMRILRDGCRDATWIVAGDGDDLKLFRDLVDHYGLASRMKFIGLQDDAELASAYFACDLFCLLSREEKTAKGLMAEGFGIVFLEASSYGKPVLGLRAGGVPDAILHGVTGYLVDRDDASAIAAQICKLIDDPRERLRLGENGMQRALTDSSWSSSRVRMLNLAQSLILKDRATTPNATV